MNKKRVFVSILVALLAPGAAAVPGAVFADEAPADQLAVTAAQGDQEEAIVTDAPQDHGASASASAAGDDDALPSNETPASDLGEGDVATSPAREQAEVASVAVEARAAVEGGNLVLSASAWAQAPNNVAFEIIPASGSSRWLKGVRGADGSWALKTRLGNAVTVLGTYKVRVWATVSGSTTSVAATSFTVAAGDAQVRADGTGATAHLEASGWSIPPSNVAFQVKSPSGREAWIQASETSGGVWSAAISSMLGGVFEDGTYTVTAWATHLGATSAYASATCQIDGTEVQVAAEETTSGISFRADGFAERPRNVAFEVRLPGGTTRWIQAIALSDGAWSGALTAKDGVNAFGVYSATVWATFGSKTAPYASTTHALSLPTMQVTTARTDQGAILISALNWSATPKNVAFELTGGARSIWIQAVRGQDGSWLAEVPRSIAGARCARVWATMGVVTGAVGETAIEEGTTAHVTSELTDGSLSFTASSWSSAPSNVAFQVTGPSGISRWLQAERQPDGSWSAAATFSAVGGSWGSYHVVAWATVDSKTAPAGWDALEVTAGRISTNAVTRGTRATLSASGWAIAPENVAFKVLKPQGGEVWIQAIRQADGSWAADVSAPLNLRAWGSFSAQTVATIDGAVHYFDSARFTVSAGSVRVNAAVGTASFTLTAQGWTRVPSNVAFRVDTPTGTIWLQGVRKSDGSWTATAGQENGLIVMGKHIATAYATSEGVTLPFDTVNFIFYPCYPLYASASAVERHIVDTALATPSPGGGLCAMWVEQVYERAGVASFFGDARDLYWAYCTSADPLQLRVGMLVATPSHPHTTMGSIYGHVGIYMGDGKIISNVGKIKIELLDDFIRHYGVTHQVRWGFPTR